jgi:phenylacetate-coenzyme A ligase PaaK-like adenylate-forming protein
MFSISSIKSIAKKVPYPVFQAAATLWGCIPIGWRLGVAYKNTLNLLQQAESWSPERISEWQLNRLKKLLEHAATNVPWYKETFKSIRFNWREVTKLEDIQYLPTLNKHQIRENMEAFMAENIDRRWAKLALTGGSTGTPLTFYLDSNNSLIEQAFLSHILQRFNARIGEPFLVLRTQRKSRNPKTPFWTYNPQRNQLVISSYLMHEDSFHQILHVIRKFSPAYVVAIPSTAALFSHYLFQSGEDIGKPPKVIILGSENSYSKQREFISKAFKCETIMHYGQGEAVAMAEEDFQLGRYHVNPFYSLTEVIDENGNAIKEANGQGEIVGTSFHNFIMPFIRYRTGDIATISHDTSMWGIKGNLWERIDGRAVELIKTKDGRWIMIAALLFGTHDETLANVVKLQVDQKKQGDLLLRIIKNSKYTSQDEQNIKTMIDELSNGGFNVSFEYINNIPKTESGKHKLLIQHLTLPRRVAN